MAKQFKDAAAAARPVYSTIIRSAQQEQDAHKEQDAQQEQPRTAEQDLKEALATRGHKGVKLPRINLAFRPSLLDYLRVMAAIQGVSITQYVNNLVAKDMETNADTYAQALRLTGKDL